MLKIRLQMTGRRNDRHFRVIVTEHTAGPRSGKYVEKLGFINPRTKEISIDEERAKYWLSQGAQPSDRVFNILVDRGVLQGQKRNVLPKKTPIVNEEEQSEETADLAAQDTPEATEDAADSEPTEQAEESQTEDTQTPEDSAKEESPEEKQEEQEKEAE